MDRRIMLAVEDFHRARRQASVREILARLTGQSATLLSYDEVRQKLQAREGATRKLENIPLDAIVGSVGRYNDFTRDFLPRRDSDADRWTRVKVQAEDASGLPPIDVYQIGQVYFVLDGNHRVSISRQLGATHIQAYVTPVHTRVDLSPDVQPDDLIVKAEYADFLEHTHLDELRPGADLSVTAPGQYRALAEHIDVHRYFMGLDQKRDISYEEAITHWYDVVYLPVVQVIRERGMLWDFPGRTETDLYLWLSEHRAALAEELGWYVSPAAAATDWVAQHGTRPQRRIARVGERILDAVIPDELEAGPLPGQWRKERSTAQYERLFADVLVAINGEETGWRALDQALVVARREGARLHGLYVATASDQKESQEALVVQIEFSRRCEVAGVTGALAVENGEVARKVCDWARWSDLIVLSLSYPPAPHPIARLDSGLSAIIRRCPRPVLLSPGETSSLERALLAYDGSPKAEEALFVASYLSCCWTIPLVVVSVAENDRPALEMLARAQGYLEAHGVQATFVEEHGAVAEAIMRTADAHESDLIIMGGYGFTPLLEIVLGSAVDEVLRTARRPTLICR